MLSNCTNINKQHSLAPQFTSLEFFGLYSTNSIRSVVTGKETEKWKYVFNYNYFIIFTVFPSINRFNFEIKRL